MRQTRWCYWPLLLFAAGCAYPSQWKKQELPTTCRRCRVDSVRVGYAKSQRESHANAAKFALMTILFGFAPLEH